MKRFVSVLIVTALALTLALSAVGCSLEKTWKPDAPAAQTVSERKYPDSAYVYEDPTATQFAVARYYSDNMIVPRNNHIVIWGTAEPDQNGKTVSAEFKGLKGSGKIAEGKWEIVLNGTLPESTELGHELTVRGAGDLSVTFKDVLVGDLWVLNGQSNAAIRFNEDPAFTAYYKDFLKSITAEEPIRLLSQTAAQILNDYSIDELNVPQEDVRNVKWSLPKKGKVTDFPMLGTFFAWKLTELNPNVPIGIINASVGGALLNTMVSEEAVENMPASIANFSGFEIGPRAIQQSYIYNAFIAPLTRIPITGMLFFQGESDSPGYSDYAEALRVSFNDYRQKFGRDFVIINMQLTSYATEKDQQGARNWPHVPETRFAQAEPMMTGTLKDYEAITTFDWGYKDGDSQYAHAVYKKQIGDRAALVAAAKVYGIGSVEDIGCPIPKKISYTKDKITLTYQHAGAGLLSTDNQVRGFRVLQGGDWIDVSDVQIQGDKIVISGLSEPAGVRYASEIFYETMDNATLTNSEGVPALAFSVTFESNDN